MFNIINAFCNHYHATANRREEKTIQREEFERFVQSNYGNVPQREKHEAWGRAMLALRTYRRYV